MTKILAFLISTLILYFLGSCSADDSRVVPSNPELKVLEVTSESIVVQWSYIPQEVVAYELGISKQILFEKATDFVSKTISNTEDKYIFEDLQSQTPYYISLRTIGSKGLISHYSSPLEIKTTFAPPQNLTLVKERTTPQELFVEWTTIIDAASYKIDLSEAEDFSIFR